MDADCFIVRSKNETRSHCEPKFIPKSVWREIIQSSNNEIFCWSSTTFEGMSKPLQIPRYLTMSIRIAIVLSHKHEDETEI